MAKVGPIQAAINGRTPFAGKAYLFRDKAYYRYTWDPEATDKGYPLPLAAWKLPAKFADKGIDAALSGEKGFEGAAYFFKGSGYVRYDWATDTTRPDVRPLTAWNLKPPFTNGVDAAFNGRETFDGKAYFFRGAEYARYDWATDRVDIDRAPLSNWKLPAPFNKGVDAALEGIGAFRGFVYFFRGNQYIRYDWKQDKIDPPFARDVAGNWRGVSEVLALDPMRAVFYNEYVAEARASEATTRIPTLFTLAQAAVESGWSTAKPGNNMFGVKAGPSWTGATQVLRTKEIFDNPNVTGFVRIHSVTQFQVPAQGGNPPRTMWSYDVDDTFRAYPSVHDSFLDRAAFLQQPRYAAAFDPPPPARLDPRRFANAIAAAGYATSPDYAPVLRGVIDGLERIGAVVE